MRRLHGDQHQARIRMLAFDQLPRSIRDFMNDSASDFPPVDVLNYYAKYGEERTLQHLQQSEYRERIRRSWELKQELRKAGGAIVQQLRVTGLGRPMEVIGGQRPKSLDQQLIDAIMAGGGSIERIG